MSKACIFWIIAIFLLIVVVLAIVLPIVLTHKPQEDSTISWDGYLISNNKYIFKDNDNEILEDIDNKNKLPNTSLSDIVRQNDTKINSTSNSNDTA